MSYKSSLLFVLPLMTALPPIHTVYGISIYVVTNGGPKTVLPFSRRDNPFRARFSAVFMETIGRIIRSSPDRSNVSSFTERRGLWPEQD
jgi:hypothetical protein